MFFCKCLKWVLLALLLVSLDLHAGRPFLTDDATIVDDCQIESWWQREAGENSYWAMPACRAGIVELAVAYGKYHSTEADEYELAAKVLLREMDESDLGVTLELAHSSEEGQAFKGDSQLVLALSKAWLDESWVLHANAGIVRHHQESEDWLLGLALQWSPLEKHGGFIELFREEAGRPLLQVGYICEPIKDVLQLDVSYAEQLQRSAQQRLFTLGWVYAFSF